MRGSRQRLALMITYALGRALYVALTNSCNTTPLFLTRGPGFKITSAAFAPLCPDRPDYPSTAQVVAAVRSELSQAPQKHDSVVFAGFGEPTLRLPDLLEITRVSASLPASAQFTSPQVP